MVDWSLVVVSARLAESRRTAKKPPDGGVFCSSDGERTAPSGGFLARRGLRLLLRGRPMNRASLPDVASSTKNAGRHCADQRFFCF
ncbi:MAG: hypothetical protein ACOVSW_00685 [Candidatus Kapaibacteriota bacterium]